METVKQIRTSAAERGAQKPAGAASSVFDLVSAPPKPARIDPAKVEIQRGVPLPPANSGRTAYVAALLDRMGSGDSLELPTKQAKVFVARARQQGVKTAMRTVRDGIARVWRL